MAQKITYTEREQAWFVNRPAVIQLLRDIVKADPCKGLQEAAVKQAELLLRSFGEAEV